MITQRVIPAEELHITGKPVPLMQALIQSLLPRLNVLDPFIVRGTTVIPVLHLW